MAAPNPNTNPPSIVIVDNCQAPAGAGEVWDSRKNGIVTALIHSIDLTMLASMNPRREYKSSATARTVQMLARCAEYPRMAASTAVATRAGMESTAYRTFPDIDPSFDLECVGIPRLQHCRRASRCAAPRTSWNDDERP